MPTAPALGDAAAIEEHGARFGGDRDVTVMTQNLYVGADVDAVITALATPDPNDDIPALLEAVGTIERTDFPTRARAIALQVKRRRPEVIGLQEVSTIGVDIPPLGVSLHLDFQQLLLDALAAEGLDYVVAVRLDNFTASPAPGISLTDADVMLVDARRVEVVSAAGHTFQANLGVVAPGVDLQRGWVTISAIVGGRPYTFVSTHTEGTGPEEILLQLHALQVGEMVASLGTTSPVIAMGDFNSQPGTARLPGDGRRRLHRRVERAPARRTGLYLLPPARPLERHVRAPRADRLCVDPRLGRRARPARAPGAGAPLRRGALRPHSQPRRGADLAGRPRGRDREHHAGKGIAPLDRIPLGANERSRRDPRIPAALSFREAAVRLVSACGGAARTPAAPRTRPPPRGSGWR